jgi:hypothetical protein
MLAACSSASRQADRATYQATVLKGTSRITFSTTNDTLLIDITDPNGIGAAEIEKTAGQWPAKIVMRFHLNGLEKLDFMYGDRTVRASVASSPDHTVRETMLVAGEEATLSSNSPYWMEVTQENGYFDVEVLADFLKSGEPKFTIDWIDFYR